MVGDLSVESERAIEGPPFVCLERGASEGWRLVFNNLRPTFTDVPVSSFPPALPGKLRHARLRSLSLLQIR